MQTQKFQYMEQKYVIFVFYLFTFNAYVLFRTRHGTSSLSISQSISKSSGIGVCRNEYEEDFQNLFTSRSVYN